MAGRSVLTFCGLKPEPSKELVVFRSTNAPPIIMGCKWSSYIPNHRVVQVEEIWNAKEQRQKTAVWIVLIYLKEYEISKWGPKYLYSFALFIATWNTIDLKTKNESLNLEALCDTGKDDTPKFPRRASQFSWGSQRLQQWFFMSFTCPKSLDLKGNLDRYSHGLDVFGYRRRSHSNDSLDLSKRHRPIWSERYCI